MNSIGHYLYKIRARATQKAQKAAIELTARFYRHQDVSNTSLIQSSEAPRKTPTHFISRWIHPYFQGYAQGCEESRRVNFAQGYVEGYRNGMFVGRIQATGFLFAMYASNRLYHRFFS